MDRAGLRHHRSASGGERLIGLFSFSPPVSTGAVASDELNEAEVCFADDFSDNEINYLSSAASATETSGTNRDRRHLFSRQLQHSGILAALPATTSLKKIPPSRPVLRERDHTKSAASAPVRVPVLASAVAERRKISALVEEDEDADDDEILPPHEILARRSGRSGQSTCSVLEGVGRTLKGRDLRQVRNAIWRRTGFLD